MSSFSHKRAWETPVAIALSIRSTASGAGPGPDNFLRTDMFNRPGIAPTAPLADVGALPVPALTVTAKLGDADHRTWEGPVVTTLVI